jgi:hypothetical protein
MTEYGQSGEDGMVGGEASGVEGDVWKNLGS